MKMLISFASWAILAVAVAAGHITLSTDGVDFVGVQNTTSGINTFFGITYAEAPVNDRRWKAPVQTQYPSASGSIVINATAPGPSCIQSGPPWGAEAPAEGQDEDCLLLNVQAPVNPTSDQLPVLVFIHGGGYTSGDAVTSTGDSLVHQANGSMIYVSLQYRLGPLGFLAGEEVRADGTWNAGLLDQHAALEWVRDNIHRFGGDASKVTVTGGSAGGGSVTMQMIMRGGSSDPPFRAAVPEYPWWTPFYNDTWLEGQYNRFSQAANCQSLRCLRGLSVDEIRAATTKSYQDAYTAREYAHGTYYWGPAIDGEIIADHPLAEFSNGHFAQVPVIVDHNFDEGFLFTNYSLSTGDEIRTDLSTLWQDTTQYFTDIALKLYPESEYDKTYLRDNLYVYEDLMSSGIPVDELSSSFVRRSAIFADAVVNCPSLYIAKSTARAGLPAYKLVFNAGYQLHGATGPFIFSNVTDADGSATLGTVTILGNSTIATSLRDYLISFTLYQDPNKLARGMKQTVHWPRYDEAEQFILSIDNRGFHTYRDSDESEGCQFLSMGRGNNKGVWPQW